MAIEKTQRPITPDISRKLIINNELSEYNYIPSFDLYFDSSIPLWFYPFSYKHSFLDANLHILTNIEEPVKCQKLLKSDDALDFFSAYDFNGDKNNDFQYETNQDP